MANINSEHALMGVWGRRIGFCCFLVVSTTLIVTVLFAAALIMSGVLEW